MANTPDVLKRLDPALWADSGAHVKWLLALTRALLESQGELMKRVEACCSCSECEELRARAERLQKGEV